MEKIIALKLGVRVENNDEIKTKFFEDHYIDIEKTIEQRRRKWQLKAVMMLDFDDVKQILLRHTFLKLHLYKEDMPFLNWLNRLISNQISNILRNNYYSHARPCVQKPNGCAFNSGADSCDYTPSGKQCDECVVHRIWTQGKKRAHDVKLPLPMTGHHEIEVFDIPNTHFDLFPQIEEMHRKMEKYLKPFEYKIYHCLYVLGLSEKDTAKKLNYKSVERFKYPGYASIAKAKKTIILKARQLLESGEIDII